MKIKEKVMWTVILEDENNNPIKIMEGEFSFDEMEYERISSNYLLLKYLDRYGDTKYNHLQMNDLLDDLHQLKNYYPDNNNLVEVIKMAITCKESTHYYLCFYGD